MKKMLLAALAATMCSSAFATNLIYNNQVLTFNDPFFDRVDEFGSPDFNGLEVNYKAFDFYVTASGTYDVEMAIRDSNSSADTYLLLYTNSFDPLNPTVNFNSGSDDSNEDLNVLTSNTYYFSSEGRSTINSIALTANTQYIAVATTFDFSATLFDDITYDLGIGNGQGDVIAGAPVPEPATMLIMGGIALAAARRRRK
jgi:hypothetical protein